MTKHSFVVAHDAALMLCANLSLFVERYAITGALRRIKSHLDTGGVVSEDWGLPKIEVLVIPKKRTQFVVEEHTLFGDRGRHEIYDELQERLAALGYFLINSTPHLVKMWVPIPESHGGGQIGCELHICEREWNWGYMIAKTTGPGEFWTRLAMMIPIGYTLRDTEMHTPGIVDTTGKFATEAAFFDFVGLEYVAPHERKFLGVEKEPA